MRTPKADRPSSWRAILLLTAAVLIPACGSSSNSAAPGSNYTAPTAAVLSDTATVFFSTNFDALQSAVAVPGGGGGFYAAGYLGGAATGDPRVVIVVKILNNGTLDATFNGDGIAVTTLATTGANDEIDIALQTQGANAGKILVATTVPTSTTERDIGVIRLDTNGGLDGSFAPGAPIGSGIRIFSFTTGLTDICRSIAVSPSTDEIFLHSSTPATGVSSGTGAARTDSDFAVLKLSADGDRDMTFAAGAGIFLLDLNESNATPRGIKVLSGIGGESILCSGYSTSYGEFPQPVIYKLTTGGARFSINPPAGSPNPFGGNSVYTGTPLEQQTEVYNFAVHGDYIVTGGYGRDSGTRNDWVSLRILWQTALANPKAGSRDLSWGGSPRGTSMINPSPDIAVGSNCRNAIALPDGKTLLIGSTGPNTTSDAVWAVLDASGHPDIEYGAGPQVYTAGSTFNDAFWGGASNATHAIAVGTRGGGVAGNDSSFVVLIPLQ